jgi:hypothetical protein
MGHPPSDGRLAKGGNGLMMMLRIYKRTALAAVVGAGLSAFVGCGGDDLPKRYPVYGTVTYKGKPLEWGTITFTPDDLNKGRSAGGSIKDGYYSLASLTTDDGAMAGHYKVTVVAEKANTEGMDPKLKTMYEKAISSPGVPIPSQAKKKVKTEYLVPKKYRDPQTSGLQADVRERTTRSISTCRIETPWSRRRPCRPCRSRSVAVYTYVIDVHVS